MSFTRPTPPEGIPDPFQLEDSDEETSSEEESEEEQSGRHLDTRNPRSDPSSALQSPLPHDVPLGSPIPPVAGVKLPPVVPTIKPQHPLPPPPRDEAEVPALFLPALISPSLFLPIPNTDQLSILLNKYIAPEVRPARDLSGAWQHTDAHSLVMTNSWRALARMFWYLRLSSLARLRLFNQAAAECNNFFAVLSSNTLPELVRSYLFDSLLPFELEVMRARTKYWANDPYGYIDDLYALLNKCKRKARGTSVEADVEMWKERAVRMGLIIATQLIEMKEHTAAASLLLPLCSQQPNLPTPSPALLSSVARIYLDSGDLDDAATLFQKVEAHPDCDETTKDINRSLLASARLDWQTAVDSLRSAVQREPENAVVLNNLGVALLSIGHLDEGIKYMESALATSPSVVGNVEPFLFNLATLYELRTAASFDKKCDLLLEISKWAGDGLRANCLKLPPV